MERRQKIELLKGIASGAISLKDLKPKNYLIRIGYGEGGAEYLINNEVVTSSEFYRQSWPDLGNKSAGFNITYGGKDV